MRDNNKLGNEVSSLQRSLSEIKSAQQIGGDSWIIYRIVKDIYVGVGYLKTVKLEINFIPEVSGVFPVIMSIVVDSDVINNRELLQRTLNEYSYIADENTLYVANGNIRIIAQSTRKGTIKATLTNVTWW